MNPECRELLPRWDRFLDEGLSQPESTELARHLSACGRCRRELELERQLRRSLGSLPKLTMPRGLARQLETIPAVRAQRQKRLWPDWLPGKPPALWPAAAAVLAVAGLFLFRPAAAPDVEHATSYSQEEIAQARGQALWCLAFVGRIIRDSEESAVTEVFGEQLPQAVRSGLRLQARPAEGGRG